MAVQLVDYLRQCGLGDAGTSVELLVREFLSLVRSDPNLRALLGVGYADSSQRSEMVEGAMATFMNHCLGDTLV